jgi:hypothetical protein
MRDENSQARRRREVRGDTDESTPREDMISAHTIPSTKRITPARLPSSWMPVRKCCTVRRVWLVAKYLAALPRPIRRSALTFAPTPPVIPSVVRRDRSWLVSLKRGGETGASQHRTPELPSRFNTDPIHPKRATQPSPGPLPYGETWAGFLPVYLDEARIVRLRAVVSLYCVLTPTPTRPGRSFTPPPRLFSLASAPWPG